MYEYKAKVLRIVDGDTIDVQVSFGMDIYAHKRVRLARINTPETYGVKKESAEYKAGLKAKNRMVELVENQEIVIKTIKDKTGKFGRYLVEVFLKDGTNVNNLLLQEGLAKPYGK